MENKIFKVVFVRHGESVWNLENIFTGWTDVPLSDTGIMEAKEAGLLLKEKGFIFDICYTSVLKRAITTFNIIGNYNSIDKASGGNGYALHTSY